MSDVKVFLISSSQLSAQEKNIRNVIKLWSDTNVHHYWDGNRRVGSVIQPFIDGLQGPAWDVWLVYGPGTTWDKLAPQPDWWEHQLSKLDASYADRRLDATRFATKVTEIGTTETTHE